MWIELGDETFLRFFIPHMYLQSNIDLQYQFILIQSSMLTDKIRLWSKDWES